VIAAMVTLWTFRCGDLVVFIVWHFSAKLWLCNGGNVQITTFVHAIVKADKNLYLCGLKSIGDKVKIKS